MRSFMRIVENRIWDHGDVDLDYGKWSPQHGIDNFVRTEFTVGGCGYLALAIHEKTGWPIVAETSDGEIEHVWCLNPGGMAVDINGIHPDGFALTKYHDSVWGGNADQSLRGNVVPVDSKVLASENSDIDMMTWARQLVELFPHHFGVS